MASRLENVVYKISYFVTRTADDGLPVGDFKLVNPASSLFCCGHVQRIQVCQEISSNSTFIRAAADCLPEMKKGCVYKIGMKLDASTFDICGAQCSCPAGKDPKASCKHIAALCYALE